MSGPVGDAIRVAWKNHADDIGTTITASSEVSSLPWDNVKNHIPEKKGRSDGLPSSVTVDFDLGSAKAVQQFAILKHNFSAGATVSLLGATNSAFSPAAINVAGITYAEGLMLWEFVSEQSYRYWRVKIEDSGNTNGYVEAGHVFLGPYDEFDFPFQATNLMKIDPSVKVSSWNGSISSFRRTHMRAVEFNLSPIDQVDRRKIEDLFDEIGNADAAYLFLDPENKRDNEDASSALDGLHRLTIFGFLNSNFSLDHMIQEWHRPESFVFQESI